MVEPLVSFEQLQARPGFELVTKEQVEGLLEDASDMVRDFVEPELDEVDHTDAPGTVRVVVVNMVRRGIQNPRGVVQESLGDYSYSMFGATGATAIYMTPREERLVRRAVGKLGAGGLKMTTDLPRQLSETTVTGVGDDITGHL